MMCQDTDIPKIAAAHGLDPRAVEDTLHALRCHGWHCYPPGSAALELVEAAREMVRTEREAQESLAGAPLGASPSYYMGRARDAANALVAAARKVAGEEP